MVEDISRTIKVNVEWNGEKAGDLLKIIKEGNVIPIDVKINGSSGLDKLRNEVQRILTVDVTPVVKPGMAKNLKAQFASLFEGADNPLARIQNFINEFSHIKLSTVIDDKVFEDFSTLMEQVDKLSDIAIAKNVKYNGDRNPIKLSALIDWKQFNDAYIGAKQYEEATFLKDNPVILTSELDISNIQRTVNRNPIRISALIDWTAFNETYINAKRAEESSYLKDNPLKLSTYLDTSEIERRIASNPVKLNAMVNWASLYDSYLAGVKSFVASLPITEIDMHCNLIGANTNVKGVEDWLRNSPLLVATRIDWQSFNESYLSGKPSEEQALKSNPILLSATLEQSSVERFWNDVKLYFENHIIPVKLQLDPNSAVVNAVTGKKLTKEAARAMPDTYTKPSIRLKDFSSERALIQEVESKLGPNHEWVMRMNELIDELDKINAKSLGGKVLPQEKELVDIYRKFYEMQTAGEEAEEEKVKKQHPLLKKVLSSVFGDVIRTVANKVVGLINKVSNTIGNIIKRIVKLTIKPFTSSIKLFVNAIKSAAGKSRVLSSISELLIMPLVLAVEFTLLPVLKKLIPSVKNVIDWVVQSKDKFDLLGQGIANVVTSIYKLLSSNLILQVTNFFEDLSKDGKGITDLYNSLDGLNTSVSSLAQTALDAKSEYDSIMSGDNTNFFANFVDKMFTAMVDSIDTLIEGVEKYLLKPDTLNRISSIMERIIDSFLKALSKTTTIAEQLLTILLSSLDKALNNPDDSGFMSKITENITKIVTRVLDIASKVLLNPDVIAGIFRLLDATKPIWLSVLGVKAASSVGETALNGALFGFGGAAAGTAGGGLIGKLGEKIKSNKKIEQEAMNIANTLHTTTNTAAPKGLSAGVGKAASTGTKISLKGLSKFLGPIGAMISGAFSVADFADNMNYVNNADVNRIKFKDLWNKLSEDPLSPVDWSAKLGLEINTIQKILQNSQYTREDIDNMTLAEVSEVLSQIDNCGKLLKFTGESAIINLDASQLPTIDNLSKIVDAKDTQVSISIDNRINIDRDNRVTSISPITNVTNGILNLFKAKNMVNGV